MKASTLECPACRSPRRVYFDTDGNGGLLEQWDACRTCNGTAVPATLRKVVKLDPVKFCPQCGEQLTRKLYGSRKRMESLTHLKARRFCGAACSRAWLRSNANIASHAMKRGPYKKREKA